MLIGPFYPSRRSFFRSVITTSLLTVTGPSGWITKTLAMGTSGISQGVRRIQGSVTVNGLSAQIGTIVNVGDEVVTGVGSEVIFVVARSVYLLRDNTRMTVETVESKDMKAKSIVTLKLLRGKMLGVFGGRQHHITTPTAVMGVRGSGAYVEAFVNHTYVCICYGIGELKSHHDPSVSETIRTVHHESPRFIYPPDRPQIITRAPVFNHTDAELFMLERIAGRTPPFADTEGDSGSY